MTATAPRRASWRPLRAMVRPYRKELRYALASGVLHQVLFVAGAGVGAYVLGRAATGADYNQLYGLLLLVGVLVVAQVRTPWIEAAVLNRVAFRLQVELRDRIYASYRSLPPSRLRARRSGDLAAGVIADVDVLQRFFAQALAPLPAACITPLLVLVALAAMAWPLAVLLAPFLASAAAAPWAFGGRERDVRDAPAALRAELVDAVQGLPEVLAFGREGDVLAGLERQTDEAEAYEARGLRASRARRLGVDALAAAGTLVVLLAGSALVGGGSLSKPLLATAVVLAAASFGPLSRISEAVRDLHAATAAAARIVAVLDEGGPDDGKLDASSTPPGVIAPSICFQDVSYRYEHDLPAAVDGVSFDVPAGASVALVGHSGAGKSTCASLLLRFADPDSGVITVGGVDIASLPAETVRSLIAYVPQDPYLFNASVRDNLRLGRPDASDEEVEAAAAGALVEELIAALPEGYGTVLGERAAYLSGGQRQRIAIARALLQDAPILLLDESMSNLDTETERDLHDALNRLQQGRTTLVIAHRESTIRRADRVVVLEHGRVVAAGTHDDLRRRGIEPDACVT